MENDTVKVLVVDDEQDIRTLLNIYLRDWDMMWLRLWTAWKLSRRSGQITV